MTLTFQKTGMSMLDRTKQVPPPAILIGKTNPIAKMPISM